ncbi:MAG: RagB/SusD family nutrient uptake outer membrane protein [Odoribacter sp.]|nr:RagB/SusD family nutrient uptake outer membrane protein [Odoribacter sp.]
MKKRYIYIWMSLVLFMGTSCSDFLNENSKNQTYVTCIEDLNELILGEGYMPMQFYNETSITGTCAIGSWIHVMDDDSKVNNNSPENTVYVNSLGPFHYWLEQPFINPTSLVSYTDRTWEKLYKHINALNAILFELEEYKGEKRYAQLKGEACFLRAMYYYFLVNIYGRPYKEQTALTDQGVPVKLSERVEDVNYQHASVAEVYKVITDDLETAVACLKGVEQTSIYRVNEMAARTFLSRVYLYMCQWDKVVAECDEVLKSSYALLDFTQLKATDNKVFGNSPEVIFSNGDNRMLAISYSKTQYSVSGGSAYSAGQAATFIASDELIALYDQEKDARFHYFEWAENRYNAAQNKDLRGYYVTFKLCRNYSDGDLVSDFFTLRLPEVYLNKAEALAMLGQDAEAASALEKLREKRFTSDANVSETGKELSDLIRDERRRELCFEGHRWFDLKRYAVHPKYPMRKKIYHGFDSEHVGRYDSFYVLPEYAENGSNNYMMPIPESEIIINDGSLLANPRQDPEIVTEVES